MKRHDISISSLAYDMNPTTSNDIFIWTFITMMFRNMKVQWKDNASKKFSYCRGSAHLRLLLYSRLFKVTDLVPIKMPYATCYSWIILTYILSITISSYHTVQTLYDDASMPGRHCSQYLAVHWAPVSEGCFTLARVLAGSTHGKSQKSSFTIVCSHWREYSHHSREYSRTFAVKTTCLHEWIGEKVNFYLKPNWKPTTILLILSYICRFSGKDLNNLTSCWANTSNLYIHEIK